MNTPPPTTGISELPDQSIMNFAPVEYRNRLDRLSTTLREQDIDVYIGTTPENLNYFTGFDPLGLYFYQHLTFTPGADEPTLLTHKCEKELARIQCWIQDIRHWQHGDDPIGMTVAQLRDLGVRAGSRVGLEMDNWYLKASTYRALVEALPDVEFVDVTVPVLRLRTIKSPAEINRMRKAAEFSDIGFRAAIDTLRPGVREVDLLAAVQSAMTTAGSEYPTLPFIIGAGPRSGLFHGVPTERVVEKGDPVMLEITGSHGRYNSNIVRTVVAGEASPMLKELWKIANDAFWIPFEQVRPGTPVSELDRLSREARRAYADYIPARAGFGMGLAYPPVWAGRPDVLVGNDEVLEPGMIFSLEPSVAQYHGTTVIFGYNILVTSTGAEILQQTPAEIFEVGC
ncbi:Xaa-Pro peptidase family protein [uncultured Kocuria sp.]|uniref:M24 family metallopeptidase n=1 Tax=uncultured Kocuria sp. TaxID=259305 RepID=UPI002604C729|nr:Xaa-Pro peptidase family protein [uncultured Kocuria sp.]